MSKKNPLAFFYWLAVWSCNFIHCKYNFFFFQNVSLSKIAFYWKELHYITHSRNCYQWVMIVKGCVILKEHYCPARNHTTLHDHVLLVTFSIVLRLCHLILKVKMWTLVLFLRMISATERKVAWSKDAFSDPWNENNNKKPVNIT